MLYPCSVGKQQRGAFLYRFIAPALAASLFSEIDMNCSSTWSVACIHLNLVGGFEHEFYFPYIGNNRSNWLSYFSGGLKPRIRLETRVLLESTPDLSSSVNLVMTDTCWVNSRADSLWHSVLCYTVTSRFDLSAIPCFFTTISELELSLFIHMLAGTWVCK